MTKKNYSSRYNLKTVQTTKTRNPLNKKETVINPFANGYKHTTAEEFVNKLKSEKYRRIKNK